MPALVPALKSALLSPLRNGPRTVVWAREGMGFANLLYLWLAASRAQARGEDVVVRHTPVADPWLAVLPALRALTVDDPAIRFRDRRDLGFHQAFGTDFTREQLVAFVRERLLGSPLLDGVTTTGSEALTVNVRRGDYYSVARWRGRYSFDVAEYVRTAVGRSIEVDGPVERVQVVSDDPEWCRVKLGFLGELGGVDAVDHLPAGSPHEHFRALAGSRRLVLANSTFSYWGAHVANVLHGDNHAQVWAPWFHRRDIDGGRAWHLDPAWSVVRDIPGGWDG